MESTNDGNIPFSVAPDALTRSMACYGRPKGSDLLGRTEMFHAYQQRRHEVNLWPYSRSLCGMPATSCEVRSEDGLPASGVNFASQDYLGLSSHPAIRDVAAQALYQYGPHSAGSPVLLGNTTPSLHLEKSLATFLEMEHVLLYPTGWAAGFGVITGLVRKQDYVLIDNLAHACLQQGSYAATANVIRYPHLDVEAVRNILRDVRSRDVRAGILVVTEGLFSMDADWPDLRALQACCREYEATLLVDVAHDLGAMGQHGRGGLEMQGVLHEVDLVMGSFSKTFASNGGFVATRSAAVKTFMKIFSGPYTFSNALSPVQAAVINKALEIVASEEGAVLRRQLMTAVGSLREALEQNGVACLGNPSPIVPALVGAESVSRIASAILVKKKVLANQVEFPAVAIGSARFRMQVMATHTMKQALDAAGHVASAILEAEQWVRLQATYREAAKVVAA